MALYSLQRLLTYTELHTHGPTQLLLLELWPSIQYGIRMAGETENLMTSVERLLAYTELPAEEPRSRADVGAKSGADVDWPRTGALEFCKVRAMRARAHIARARTRARTR